VYQGGTAPVDEFPHNSRVFVTSSQLGDYLADKLIAVGSADVKAEDPLEFGDGLRQLRRTVRAGDDLLRMRAREVRAAVGDHAVAAVGRIAPAAVAGDGMVRSADAELVDDAQRGAAGREARDAVGNDVGVSAEDGQCVAEFIAQFARNRSGQRNEVLGETADGADSEIAAAMRRANEDDALDLRVRV